MSAPETSEQSGPWFTLTDAAAQARVSRSSLRRLLDADKFPNARRTDGPAGPGTGPWEVPLGDLVANGVHLSALGSRTAERTPRELGEQPGDAVSELRAALARAEQRAAVAEAVAAERERTIDALRDALSKLPPALSEQPGQSSPVNIPIRVAPVDSTPPRRRWWQRSS